MANDKKFTTDDLKSGFIVAFRNGERRIVARAGGNNFTKILVDPLTGRWNYLCQWNRENLTCRGRLNLGHSEYIFTGNSKSYDIVCVYGLINSTTSYADALDPNSIGFRSMVWQRHEPVKMTLKQIEEKLGHEVQIVSEVNADEE